MSFSSNVKEELSNIKNLKNMESLESELLGYILTENAVITENKICYVTENEYNIERFYKILFALKIEYEPEIKGKCFKAIFDRNIYVKIFSKFENVKDENAVKTIIRGAFLGAGSITEPEKSYHLEIGFCLEDNAKYISNLCEIFDIEFKVLKLESKFVLYLKDGDQISKFLACIGANKSVLKFEDIRIFKEMKNNVNRNVNMETANLNRTIDASINQIDDIKLIQKLNKMDDLSDDLKEVAILRLENPEASLSEIGEMLDPKLSKSGVNHRLKKIHEFAKGLI